MKIDGDEVKLTAKEFLLLQYLMEHRGRVLSRDLLLSDVWGYSYTGGTRTVDVHVRRLREKLPLLAEAHRHRQAVRLQAGRPGSGLSRDHLPAPARRAAGAALALAVVALPPVVARPGRPPGAGRRDADGGPALRASAT